MSKRFAFTSIVALTLISGMTTAYALTTGPGITRSNLNRIEVGMHQSEVEAIFGGPANPVASNGFDWSFLLIT